MLKKGIGMLLVFIGGMGADSEKLWLIILLMLLGVALFFIGENDDERRR